jgi:uncharacterized protein (TIGR03437 family)
MKITLLLLVGLSRLLAADAARDARWRQDLDTLTTQLPALHPNLFFQTPRSEFFRAATELSSAIPDLSDAEVMVGLARIAALPGDGHTNLSLTQRNSTFRLLPLQLRWFEDGLFVIAAGQSYTRALGRKVIQIGDRPLGEAYQAVAGIVSHENDIWVREQSPNYLVNADILRALKIAPSAESVRFVLEDLSGSRFTLDVASLDPGGSTKGVAAPDANTGFIPFYRQQTNQNYWFTYIESSRTLYFAYNVCAEQPGLPFAQFNDQLWAVFDAQPVARFIIDLRNNTGGNSSVLDPFLVSGAARIARFHDVKPVVIIGRRTFSAAISNVIAMQQGPVTLVGEPSGGSPNSYTEAKTLTLPNSRLIVSYSTKLRSFPGYPAGSLLPDVVAQIYSSDWFARHDPFLAASLADAAPGAVSVAQQGGVAVLNSAGFRRNAPVAPGSLAAAFGDFSGVTPGDAPAVPLARQINGVQLLVNGTPAPLIAVRTGQINFQMPATALPGNATIRVQRNGNDLAAGAVQVAAAAPGLFLADALNLAMPGAALDQDSRLVSVASPARRGSVIQIYATGQGATDPPVEDGAACGPLPPAQSGLVPRVFFAGETAEVLFSGLQPAFPGLWQINVRVPESAALSGQTPVFVVMGAKASNAVTVAVN